MEYQIHMDYSVACECGHSLQVSASDAGARRSCPCGREVIVPSLRALRLAAGEAVTETPELLIKEMLRDGRVPEGDACAGCSVQTDDICFVQAECEKLEVRRSGWSDRPAGVVVALIFGWLPAWLAFRHAGEPRHIGRDLTYRLPLRMCDRCAGRLRGAALKKAMCQVPLYDRLLQKYPRAKVSLTTERD